MTKRSGFIIGLPLILVVIAICFQEHRAARMGRQWAILQGQIAAAETIRQENAQLQDQLKSATEEADGLRHELTRLRSDQTALFKENTALKAANPTPGAPARPPDPTSVPKPQPVHYTPEQTQYFFERLDFGKRIGLALRTIAEENNGQLPTNSMLIAKWLATNGVPFAGDPGPLFGVGVRSFELVYNGNLNALANPERVILAREINPVQINAELWTRMYVFGDGSVQRLEATRADDFTDREKEVWPAQP